MIIGGGLLLGHLLSSPRTRALTALISAHRFKGTAAQDNSIVGVLAAFGLPPDPAGWRDEDRKRVDRMLAAARDFDAAYGCYHWGVRAHDILHQAIQHTGAPSGPARNSIT